jgi:predicted nucleic acid-binding protein
MVVPIEAEAKGLIDLVEPILDDMEGVDFRLLEELYGRFLQVAQEGYANGPK